MLSSRLVELPTLGAPRTWGSPPSLTHSGSVRTQLASVRERKAKQSILTIFYLWDLIPLSSVSSSLKWRLCYSHPQGGMY